MRGSDSTGAILKLAKFRVCTTRTGFEDSEVRLYLLGVSDAWSDNIGEDHGAGMILDGRQSGNWDPSS